MKITLLIFFLLTGIPASIQFEQRRELEERASMAARTLRNVYVLTPNQSVRVVYANAWRGAICFEYVADDARTQPIIRYAIVEKDSKFVNYDLDLEDVAAACSLVGVDLTNVAEKELDYPTVFVSRSR